MEQVYRDWADQQQIVERPERPRDVSIETILEDPSYHRWLYFEHIRGNFLGEKPYLSETNLWGARNHITNKLTPVQMKKAEEFRALCGTPALPKEDETSKKRGAEKEGKKGGKAAKKAKK